MSDDLLEHKVLKYGQARPYQDSVYIYQVTAPKEMPEDQVWEECQKIKKVNNRKDNASHTGHCKFPFGLDSFGSLNLLNDGEETKEYKYIVTYPFCD